MLIVAGLFCFKLLFFIVIDCFYFSPAGSKNCKKVEAEYGRSPLELYDESSVMSASGRPWLMYLNFEFLKILKISFFFFT